MGNFNSGKKAHREFRLTENSAAIDLTIAVFSAARDL